MRLEILIEIETKVPSPKTIFSVKLWILKVDISHSSMQIFSIILEIATEKINNSSMSLAGFNIFWEIHEDC